MSTSTSRFLRLSNSTLTVVVSIFQCLEEADIMYAHPQGYHRMEDSVGMPPDIELPRKPSFRNLSLLISR